MSSNYMYRDDDSYYDTDESIFSDYHDEKPRRNKREKTWYMCSECGRYFRRRERVCDACGCCDIIKVEGRAYD